MARPGRGRRDDSGAAVVDFVMVLVLLVPLVIGVLQVALVMHVRNTLSNAASEGARYAAVAGATSADGVAAARSRWEGAVADDFVKSVRVEQVAVTGAPGYRLEITARVPALGLGGPAVEFTVSGSAVRELLPNEGSP